MSNSTTARSSKSDAQLWRRGFVTVFGRELQTWWMRRLLTSMIFWTVLAVILPFVVGSGLNPANGQAEVANQRLLQGLGLFFTVLTSLPMFGAIFSTRGVISDERKTGTLSWILSKPVFRWAFYLAKLAANLLVRVAIVVVLQGSLVVALVGWQSGFNFLGFVNALLLVALLLLFYTALTMMLDTMFAKGAVSIAVPVAVLIGGVFIPTLVALLTRQQALGEFLVQVTPWGLSNEVLTRLAAGIPLSQATPILCTLLWSMGFIGLGIWVFNRQEA